MVRSIRLSSRVTLWRLRTFTNNSTRKEISSKTDCMRKRASTKRNLTKIKAHTTKRWKTMRMKCAESTTDPNTMKICWLTAKNLWHTISWINLKKRAQSTTWLKTAQSPSMIKSNLLLNRVMHSKADSGPRPHTIMENQKWVCLLKMICYSLIYLVVPLEAGHLQKRMLQESPERLLWVRPPYSKE